MQALFLSYVFVVNNLNTMPWGTSPRFLLTDEMMMFGEQAAESPPKEEQPPPPPSAPAAVLNKDVAGGLQHHVVPTERCGALNAYVDVSCIIVMTLVGAVSGRPGCVISCFDLWRLGFIRSFPILN